MGGGGKESKRYPSLSQRWKDSLSDVQKIKSLRKNINNDRLFGRPGEKCQAAASSIKRGVKLRPIKRYNEGPFLELTPNTKEEYASTGGESCELAVDCTRRNQLGFKARSHITLTKRLGRGEGGMSARTSGTVTHFDGISTIDREITPPHPEFITKKDR